MLCLFTFTALAPHDELLFIAVSGGTPTGVKRVLFLFDVSMGDLVTFLISDISEFSNQDWRIRVKSSWSISFVCSLAAYSESKDIEILLGLDMFLRPFCLPKTFLPSAMDLLDPIFLKLRVSGETPSTERKLSLRLLLSFASNGVFEGSPIFVNLCQPS